MTWPAPLPTSDDAAPPTDRRQPPGAATDPAVDPAVDPVVDRAVAGETPAERHRASAIPAAAWVAVLGGCLVLLAAVVAVAGNWEAIGPAWRFAGLLAGTLGLAALAERARPVVPTTARVVAHLGAVLAAPVGIAAAATLDRPWPVCLVAGGTLAVIVTEIQGRRWRAPALHAGQVAAVSLIATGLAALTGSPAGLLAAIAAAGLMAAGSRVRAAGLAVAAIASPALVALAAAGVGAGTLERAGLAGGRLGWSGPVTGLLAAVVLLILAAQRPNAGLTLTAIGAPVIGVVTGLSAVTADDAAWWAVPALAIIAGELGWWVTTGSRTRATIAPVLDVIAVTVAVVTTVAPALVVVGRWAEADADHAWATPAALTAFALALVALRWHGDRPSRSAPAVAAAAIAGLATAIALGAAELTVAALAVTGVVVAAGLARRHPSLAVHLPAGWAFVVIGLLDADPGDHVGMLARGALLGALAVTLVLARAGTAARDGRRGLAELAVMTAITGLTAATLVPTAAGPGHGPTAFLVAVVAVAVTLVARERRLASWAVGAVALAALAATSASQHAPIGIALDPWIAVGWLAAAIGLAGVWALARTPLAACAAAAAVVITLATAATATSLTATEALGLAIALAVALTGLAWALPGNAPLDTATATAAGVLAIVSTLDVDPAWVSAAWLAIGLQAWCLGAAGRAPALRPVGAAIAALATASWWSTAGLDDRVLTWAAPHGMVADDLWMAGAALVALVAGLVARRRLGVSSWVAHTGALAIAGTWLISVVVERDTRWAVPSALAIGSVAVAVGGWRRLGGPLVGGTVLIATTLVVAAGSGLHDLPTWAWLAVGGLGLLTVAVGIERAGTRGTAGLRELIERWD